MPDILIDKAPPLFGSEEAYLGFPGDEHFAKLALQEIREHFPEPEYPTLDDIPEDEYWVVRNAISAQRDVYFRQRCRDSAVRWSRTGETPESYETYMSRELFASAYYAAWYAYNQAEAGSPEQELHRQRMVFSGVIHLNDALQRGMPFLDPSLKNDGLVRTKHFMGFLARADNLARFVRTPEEKAEVDIQRTAMQLAVAEIGAQNPVRLSTELWLIDDNLRESNERSFFHMARSRILDLSNLDRQDKIKLVERYQQAGLRGRAQDNSDDFFLMQLLHLYGVATASDYYDPETYELKYRWFVMNPEDIIDGKLAGYVPERIVEPETYEQDSLS